MSDVQDLQQLQNRPGVINWALSPVTAMRLLSLWVLLSAIAYSEASKNYKRYGKGGIQLYACGAQLNSVATFCKKRARGYACYCTNKDARASLAGCYALTGRNTTEWYDYFFTYCENYNMTLTYKNITDSYNYYLAKAVYPKEIEGFNKSVPVSVPVKSQLKSVDLWWRAYKMFLGNYDNSQYYGAGLLSYWALVFVGAIVCNWSVILFPSLRNAFNGKLSKLYRKYITLPALHRRKRTDHQKNIGILNCLVPSRFESLVVFIFFWLTFAFCAAGIHYVPGDPVMLSRKRALLRYVADRAGIMATQLTPLFILIGGRNNFLQWLTRWHFSVFITYHRWIARVVVLLAVIHSINYTELYVIRGVYKRRWKALWFNHGVLATMCGGLICFQGLLFLRRRWYEVFLVVHILLAVGWVMGLYRHVEDFGYLYYMYATIAVWCADRAVRLGRMAAFGFPKALVTLVEDETLRIEVPKPKYWSSVPGGHCWLYLGYSIHFWQSHPFTFLESATADKIVFLVKVKSGVTLSIYKKLSKLPGKSCRIRVSVEGPYGEPSAIKSHSTAVFLAGGNGIPGIYSEVVANAKKSRDANQTLRLIWIIRETKSIAWMYNELDALRTTKIQTTIYITQPDLGTASELRMMMTNGAPLESSDSNYEKYEKDDKILVEGCGLLDALKENFPHIEFKEGRPSIDGIVQTEIEECDKSVGFVTCGHPAMVDDLRRAVVENIDKTPKRLDFFEQLQVWA